MRAGTPTTLGVASLLLVDYLWRDSGMRAALGGEDDQIWPANFFVVVDWNSVYRTVFYAGRYSIEVRRQILIASFYCARSSCVPQIVPVSVRTKFTLPI